MTILAHQEQKIGSYISNNWYAQYLSNSILGVLGCSENFGFWILGEIRECQDWKPTTLGVDIRNPLFWSFWSGPDIESTQGWSRPESMHGPIILRLMCYHYANNYYQFCTTNGSRTFLRLTIISRVPQTLWPRIKTSPYYYQSCISILL